MSAESIAVWTELCAVFPEAVVSCVVSVDPNNNVTTNGLRGNTRIARSIARKALTDNADFSVWCLASAFTDSATLPGRTMAIGDTTYRITGVNQHALGGLVQLVCGQGDRVV